MGEKSLLLIVENNKGRHGNTESGHVKNIKEITNPLEMIRKSTHQIVHRKNSIIQNLLLTLANLLLTS